MTDLQTESPTQNPGGLEFFLGQLSGRLESVTRESEKAAQAASASQAQISGLAQEVVKLLGPRLSSMERRIADLEHFRFWLVGSVAGLGAVVIIIAVLSFLSK